MNIFWRIKDYLTRVGKARGFGIQSPWAYTFVTQVISEKWPYYAYEDINRMPISRREKQLRKLALRVENYVGRARFREFDVHKDSTDDIIAAARQLAPKGAIILHGIYSSPEAQQLWLQLRDNEVVGITFDLYHCAIMMLDRNIHKQHYHLNL